MISELAESYSKRFSEACNKGLQINEGLSELFMIHATDAEMNIHFAMSFPELSAAMTSSATERMDYLRTAEMYARVFARFLQHDQYSAMSRDAEAPNLIDELKRRNAPCLAAYLEAGLSR